MAFDFEQDAYRTLRSIASERTSPLIAWVGSGLSTSAGLPSWTHLRDRLLAELKNKISRYLPPDRKAAEPEMAAIEVQENLWVAFEMLKKTLGSATYKDVIRDALRPADSVAAPAAYRNLWKMPIHGLINLNIDRLATKAYVSETNNTAPLEFTGAHGTRLGTLLKGTRRFILNLHGTVDDSSTWVFTRTELQTLRNSSGYADFIRACLYTHTLLFIGISADDFAVGGHLEHLAKAKIDSGTHFWLTSRTDRATDKWAESVGIRLIKYDAPCNDHSPVDEMFTDLLAFIPPEDPPLDVPVISYSSCAPVKDPPPPAELAHKDAEEIRQILTSYAANLLSKSPTPAETYAAFMAKYDEAIYHAWYVSTTPSRNKVLGYELIEAVAKGAFGKVYRAIGPWGESLAIKILLEEIRNNTELLQSFRRGARSMQILAQHGVDGVVGYKDSSEIPAMVVMDWVEGPSLHEAVDAKLLREWNLILKVGKDLSRILRCAHELPERVLHRDLRPSNVMLKDFYTKDDWRVVVLDFDLSWHRGAAEKSVTYGSTLFGYLAPEQIQQTRGVSTRHAAVDSFGLGMLLFFMASGRSPVPDEQRHPSWPETVYLAARSVRSDEWRSAPNRFARLILNSTRDSQSQRWDMAQISAELIRLEQALMRPRSIVEADLIAEELAVRTDGLSGYMWNEDTATATVQRPSGLTLSLRGDVVRRRLSLWMDWSMSGVPTARKVSKWIRSGLESTSVILKRSGWTVYEQDSNPDMLRIRAYAAPEAIVRCLDKTAAEFDRAIEQLRVS